LVKVFYKAKKSPSAKAKGLECLGSPECNIDRTFMYKFYFQTAVKNSSIPRKTYRNPIFLAREYKKIIYSGKVKNQAELARLKGISRTRVTQILNLLKLDKNIIDRLEQNRDPMDKKVISEKELRKIIYKS
jgi:hypothetical protein